MRSSPAGRPINLLDLFRFARFLVRQHDSHIKQRVLLLSRNTHLSSIFVVTTFFDIVFLVALPPKVHKNVIERGTINHERSTINHERGTMQKHPLLLRFNALPKNILIFPTFPKRFTLPGLPHSISCQPFRKLYQK